MMLFYLVEWLFFLSLREYWSSAAAFVFFNSAMYKLFIFLSGSLVLFW